MFFEHKLFHTMQMPITDLKISGKPYKIFEVKKWNGASSFGKEFILTETTNGNEQKMFS